MAILFLALDGLRCLIRLLVFRITATASGKDGDDDGKKCGLHAKTLGDGPRAFKVPI